MQMWVPCVCVWLHVHAVLSTSMCVHMCVLYMPKPCSQMCVFPHCVRIPLSPFHLYLCPLGVFSCFFVLSV